MSFAVAALCTDQPGWQNGRNKTCDEYAGTWCTNGKLHIGAQWAAGEVFNYPERYCCACGGHASLLASAPAATPVHRTGLVTFERHHNLACKGADHQVKKVTVSTCEAHCRERSCACFHYGKGLCRFGFRFQGLTKSTSGFAAYVREGVELETLKPLPAVPQPQVSCAAAPLRIPPTFYMYEGPTFSWAERLVACYTEKHHHPPWALPTGNASLAELGPAPPVDLSHSLWLHAALTSHRRRTRTAADATLYVVPAYGSLSEAVGLCDGTSHIQRMTDAAATLKGTEEFARAPTRHIVFAAGNLDDRNPLGALGELLSRAGALALCSDRARCASHFRKRAEIPMLPLLTLKSARVRARLLSEVRTAMSSSCGGAVVSRHPTLT